MKPKHRQLVAFGDFCRIFICIKNSRNFHLHKKFPQYFEAYLEFFAVFQHFYLFIPRFLAKSYDVQRQLRLSRKPRGEITAVKFLEKDL